MGSSFTHYLNEGLIKLPPKLVASTIEYFIYWYLAFLEGTAEADKSLDEDDQDMIKLAIERLAKKFNSKTPTAVDIKKAMTNRAVFKNFPVEDIPPQYLEKVAKVKGPEAVEALKDAHVKFVVAFKDHPSIKDNGEAVFYTKPAEIYISIPNMPIEPKDMIELLSTFNHAEAGRAINRTIGTIEHEVMHAVQSMVLFLLHPIQYSTNTSKSAKPNLRGKDKYYAKDIEFSPWLKTSVKALENVFEKSKATTAQAKKDLFTKFTYGDVLSKDVTKADNQQHERSSFFKSLKKTDLEKWKKAVKLLSTEVLK